LQYETDIAQALEHIFDGELDLEDDFVLSPFPITAEAFAADAPRERSTSRKQTAQEWRDRAVFRKEMIDKYLWNEGKSLYFDYDMVKKKQSRYETVTALWPLWAGCASEHQALRLVYVLIVVHANTAVATRCPSLKSQVGLCQGLKNLVALLRSTGRTDSGVRSS
jgi:hypothetical protein